VEKESNADNENELYKPNCDMGRALLAASQESKTQDETILMIPIDSGSTNCGFQLMVGLLLTLLKVRGILNLRLNN